MSIPPETVAAWNAACRFARKWRGHVVDLYRPEGGIEQVVVTGWDGDCVVVRRLGGRRESLVYPDELITGRAYRFDRTEHLCSQYWENMPSAAPRPRYHTT